MFAAPIVLLLAIFNSYLFAEQNLFIFVFLVIIYTLLSSKDISKNIVLNSFVITIICFIFYIIYRYNGGVSEILDFTYDYRGKNQSVHIYSIISCISIFICSSILFYNYEYLRGFTWVLVSCYLVMYFIRISMDISAAQLGSNLSSGIVVITLMPLVLINFPLIFKKKYQLATCCLLLPLLLWVMIIGARAAAIGILLFALSMICWNLVSKSKILFNSLFISLIVSLMAAIPIYTIYLSDADFSLMSETNIAFFSKRIGTRQDIWVHLIELISTGEWVFGFGSDEATGRVAPLTYLDFSMNRGNLASHSLFIEIVYRIGVVGLVFFLVCLFLLWRFFWHSRNEWGTAVSASTLLMMFPICASSTFLLFSSFFLRSAFIWGSFCCLLQ